MSSSITIVARSIPAHGPGGMERATWTIATGLARLGWEVEVITTRIPGSKFVPPEDIQVRTVEGSTPGRNDRAFFRGVRSILNQGDQHRPVMAVSAAGFDYLSVPRSQRRAVFLVCHGTSWNEIKSKFRVFTPRSLLGLTRQLLWIPRDLLAYRAADRIIAISEHTANQIRRALPPNEHSKVVTVHNGVELPDTGSPTLPGPDAGPGHPLKLCVSGRLVREKGVHLLLDAVGRIAPSMRPSLWICGDGPEKARLQRQAQRLKLETVVFAGHVTNVAPYLLASDALVLPTLRFEGCLPLSMLEALAAGRPVIIPDHLPVGEVKQNGILRFRSGSVTSLLESIAALGQFKQPVRLAKEFTVEQMVRSYAEVALSLARRNFQSSKGRRPAFQSVHESS